MSFRDEWEKVVERRRIHAFAFALETCESIEVEKGIFHFDDWQKADAVFCRFMQEQLGCYMNGCKVQVYL